MAPNDNDRLWDPHPRIAGDEPAHEQPAPPPARRGRGAARSVLVELAGGPGTSPMSAMSTARSLEASGLAVDEDYGAVPMAAEGGQTTFVVHGEVADDGTVADLERHPEVVRVWPDTPIAPFDDR
ncbi:MAG: hypothetical protein ACLGI2_11585 [Acidimicrobiia bacterium]